MTKIMIVYHSGYGHTKLQAEAVRDGAASVEGAEVHLLTADEAKADLAPFDDADAIVFGAPTYMGSPSAPMKAFMDATSEAWLEARWQDKIAGGFTNSGSPSGDKVNTLQAFSVLAAQLGMVWVGQSALTEWYDPAFDGPRETAVNRLGGYLGAMAQSENAEPGPDNPPAGDIRTARGYGARIAKAAKRWGAGQLD